MRFVPLYLTHTPKFTFVITERIVYDILCELKIIELKYVHEIIIIKTQQLKKCLCAQTT